MKSMCHFAAEIPAPHDHSNMLKIHTGPRNPPVGQSLITDNNRQQSSSEYLGFSTSWYIGDSGVLVLLVIQGTSYITLGTVS